MSAIPFAVLVPQTERPGNGMPLGLLADRGQPVRDVISIGALLDGINRLFAVETRRKGVPLRFHVGPQLRAAVRIDSLRLRHILANFVGNALMDAESGEIEIGAYAITFPDGGPGVQFIVSGAAVASPHVPPQSAGRDRRDDKRPWTICERLAAQMGGSIQLDAAADGRITRTLLLMLPRIAGEQSAPPRMRRLGSGQRQVGS